MLIYIYSILFLNIVASWPSHLNLFVRLVYMYLCILCIVKNKNKEFVIMKTNELWIILIVLLKIFMDLRQF
jgi:hypothetical protein